jgi:hypothetical protein
MPNGRCRMHGGPSPGAPKGNRNAFKHGRYSGEAIARRRAISLLVCNARGLLASCRCPTGFGLCARVQDRCASPVYPRLTFRSLRCNWPKLSCIDSSCHYHSPFLMRCVKGHIRGFSALIPLILEARLRRSVRAGDQRQELKLPTRI